MSDLSPKRSLDGIEETETLDDEGRESLELNLPIQIHSRPATPKVPTLDIREHSLDEERLDYDDDDEHILLAAQELGLILPPEPKPESLSLDDVNASSLTVSSSLPETNTLQSRTSQSTRPTSYNSSEPPFAQRVASPTMSMSAASTYVRRGRGTPSISSTTSTPYSKIRKSIRRLSTFTKRLSAAPSPPSLFPDTNSLASQMKDARPSTSRSAAPPRDRLSPPRTTHQMSAMILPSLSESRLSAIYPPSTFQAITPPPEEDLVSDQHNLEAIERSLRSTRLQQLRIHQLEEQSSFLRFHFSALDTIRTRYAEERRLATSALKEKQESLQARHAERLADLETRHLAAEIDLTETLSAERRACETKLKHMDAYCNNRQSLVPNGPPRKVTEDDFRKLVEQYNVRNGLASLHEGRINVLREKQAKQLERVAARQEAELGALVEQGVGEAERAEGARRREEGDAAREFAFRKGKLVWRWKVVEAVERRRLELERGEGYGELPEVQWAEDGWLTAAL